MHFFSNEVLNDEMKIKGSIFKVLSYKIENINCVKIYLKKIEDKYSDASHICYGYRFCDINHLDLFFNPEVIEFSTDAGEPSGTAGKPILNTLKEKNIVNRVIFVIRYFGGTKLGIAGLIDAYRESSKLITENIKIKEWILYKNFKLKLNYCFYKSLKDLIFKYEGKINTNKFSDDIELNFDIPYKNSIEFKEKLINRSKGTIIIQE